MAEIVKELEVPKRFNYDYSKKDLSCFLGNHSTIKFIHDVYYNIAFSNIFCENGARPKKSFLLEGENGTGKTLAVKCIVGELFKRGINTHVEEYSIGTHGSHFVDKGSINLQEFFTKAQDKLILMLKNIVLGLMVLILLIKEVLIYRNFLLKLKIN